MKTKIYRFAKDGNLTTSTQESSCKEEFVLEVAEALGLLGPNYGFQFTYNPYYSFTQDNVVVFGIEIYRKNNVVRRCEFGSDIVSGNGHIALEAAVEYVCNQHQEMLKRVQETTAVFLKFAKD
jgi:hypothetical protein